MKKQAIIMALSLLLCAMLGTLALAKSKYRTLSFSENTTVNGTVVKKGEYQVKFDEQTSEFSILDGRHVLVTTKAKEEVLDKKASATTFDLKAGDNGQVLTKVIFGGEHYAKARSMCLEFRLQAVLARRQTA